MLAPQGEQDTVFARRHFFAESWIAVLHPGSNPSQFKANSLPWLFYRVLACVGWLIGCTMFPGSFARERFGPGNVPENPNDQVYCLARLSSTQIEVTAR
jgi:hypothetical protein